MTPAEALALIDQQLGFMNGTRDQHAQLTIAVEILRNAIAPADEDA